jgi:cold shock protein
MKSPMLTGIIKTWNDARGFGFISRDDRERDVFVHVNARADGLKEPLHPGTRVEFEIGEGRDGRAAAKNVRVIA